jgi:hypothetical protein
VYAATSDSTVASHDTISDFVHGSDVIDTSAITAITAVAGLITGVTQVAPHSIVWIQSGSNTIVYANASGVAENQGSADMEIVLTNVTASTLTNSDFSTSNREGKYFKEQGLFGYGRSSRPFEPLTIRVGRSGVSWSTGCAQIRAVQGRFSTTNLFPFPPGAALDDARGKGAR